MTSNTSSPRPLAAFIADHRACDALWGDIESAVESGDTARITGLWGDFERAMRRHFDLEEKILFPSFEDATGMHGGGPTAVMRGEHQQMRALLDEMATTVKGGSLDTLLDQGDTLLMLAQQHNTKEEGMLYPMAERALAHVWEDVAARIASF
jgi:iron-sulfur cluster repair protein YtfE (RIC family)